MMKLCCVVAGGVIYGLMVCRLLQIEEIATKNCVIDE